MSSQRLRDGPGCDVEPGAGLDGDKETRKLKLMIMKAAKREGGFVLRVVQYVGV